MDTNKILSAHLLDLVFDDRNKDYGAYELRVTYPERIKKSLIITASIAAVIFTGTVLANSVKSNEPVTIATKEITLQAVEDEIILPEPEPEIVKPPEEQPQTVHLSIPVLADIVETPPPTQTEIADAKIDVKTQDGVVDDGLRVDEKAVGDGKGIVEAKPTEDPDAIVPNVQIEARFDGNWNRFLEKNLNANVPIDNGAAAGRYKVLVQFIVDREGNVSDIKPISNVGYGMEQEAVRVLRKAEKWVPAIQNGYKVKAYRTQVIIFEVLSDE